MTANDKRAERRVPVALRIRLRYSDVDQFISKFAINISRGGMFLSSRNPKAVGTHLHFEMRLADDSPVIEGTGEVRWIREYDRHQPNQPHGMGIRFYELKPDSLVILERIIEHRRSVGEPDTDSIPVPRASDGGGPAPIPAVASVVSQPVPMMAPPVMPREPVAEVPLSTVEAVPPARESGPPAGIDDAIARARRLADRLVASAGEIERELAALLEPVEVPLATSVDEASRDLAQRLGGQPVIRGAPGAAAPPRTSNGVDDTGTSVKVDPADVLEEMDAGAGDFGSDDVPTSVGEPGVEATPRAGRGRGKTARG
jgi:uncharacterized protein (TIGR02266 family)